jgi:anaerobic nitric oxide reductase transcription regulator
VRELDHVLARAALRAATRTERGGVAHIEIADLDSASPVHAESQSSDALQSRTVSGQLSFKDAVDEFKRGIVERALNETKGNWAEAARKLGMHRSNLHHMARRLKISR